MKAEIGTMMTRKDFIKHFGGDAEACEKFATFLACAAFDNHAKKYELDLEGVTEAGIEKGDWTITIQRTDI